MQRCPELADLEAFFGTSATAAYGNEGGWYYDSLSFVHRSEHEYLLCKLEPAEGVFSVLKTIHGQVHVDIALQYVATLDLEHSAGTELLIGRVSHSGVEQLFKLSLNPTFSFRLVTALPTYD